MADLEIDDDVRERFAYLFKPITDFAKNFEIDIIELLQEYDNRTLSSETGFNFVNAAAMLQGTTGVYSRRVDILHKAVTTFQAEFSKQPEKEKKKKQKAEGEEEEEDGETSRREDDGGKVTFQENGTIERCDDDGLCIFDMFYVDKKSHYPIHICKEREYQLMFIMPGSMMPLLSTEKRPVELLGNYGKFGDVDDYRMCRDLVVHNYALYCNPGGTFCYPSSERVDVCQVINSQVRHCMKYVRDHNLLPSSCAQEVEATLRNDVQTGRAAYDLVEICRRISDNQQAADFIRRLSHYVTLIDNERRKSGLLSQPFGSQEPEVPLEEYDFDFDGPDDNHFSISGVNFKSLVRLDDNGVIPDSLAFDAPLIGPVTRSRQAQIDAANEPRRSARLSEQNRADVGMDQANDEFELLDMYEETIYKYKPFSKRKPMKCTAREHARRRDNRIKKEFEREGKVYLPTLQWYLDNYYWTKREKKRLKKDSYDLIFTHQMENELRRRKEVRAELRKQQMAGIRSKKTLLKNNGMLVLPEVGARAKKSMEILQQQIAENTQDAVPENEGYDDFDDDFDVPEERQCPTPLPLGDVMPDNPVGIDLADLTRLSLRRNNRSTMANSSRLQPASQPFDHDHDFDMLPPPSQDNDPLLLPAPSSQNDYVLPPNATISAIVQVHLSKKWTEAVKRQPERQERLVKWETKMIPVLEALSDDYLAHDYGKKILDKFEGEVGKRMLFSEITEGNMKDKSRYFLACLMLTNRGTVLIYPPPLELDKENSPFGKVDEDVPLDFEVELLEDSEWEGNEMNRTGLFI